MYKTVNNILSENTLAKLEKYCEILPTDDSSYDIWDPASTLNNTLPENYSNQLSGITKTSIIYELYENRELPCYKQKWIKHADIAIQKVVPGGSIPKHTDSCRFSLTVFLNEVAGGEFVWYDNAAHTVNVSPNMGVYAYYDKCIRGAEHEVLQVRDKTRYTLQLFVFDKSEHGKNTNISAQWSNKNEEN